MFIQSAGTIKNFSKEMRCYNMDIRRLGNIEVSSIGMGCMGFSHGYGKVPEESYCINVIQKAYDFGCTFFDTAEIYGMEMFYAGHNEQLV